MGNSPKLAQKQYLQVSEEHFEKTQQQQPAVIPENALQSTVTGNKETPKNAANQHFTGFKDSGGGIRTPDTRIMIPLL